MNQDEFTPDVAKQEEFTKLVARLMQAFSDFIVVIEAALELTLPILRPLVQQSAYKEHRKPRRNHPQRRHHAR